MTEYRLDGLSPRAFEHLVQSLAIREIGQQTMPFGDGADGGREATFDGPTQYGPESHRWNGYGVIQAKFRQRLKEDDGDWAVGELRKELRRFVGARRVRRMPDYYVFATNVILTPVQGIGSKDRVLSELQMFAEQNGLRGFDVWDYDKIRNLLDNNDDVRRANSAWITAGDVLADLAEYLSEQVPDLYQVVTNFLQKELSADQYAKLEQAGHSADDPIPLSQVFVDLPVSAEPVQDVESPTAPAVEYRNFAAEVILAAADRFVEDDEPSQQALSDADDGRSGRYVLIGGPGQGKTTVGQYICQVFRTAILMDVERRLLDVPVRLAMRDVVQQWEQSNVPRPSARRLPFRIVLSEYAKKLAEGEVFGVLDYLALQVSRRGGAHISVANIKRLLLAYPSILILDGLDEVPASTNREDLLSTVQDFRIDVVSAGIDVLIVATSRPQGYNRDFSPVLYQHWYLAPLPNAVALDYATKLTHIRFGQEPERCEKVIARLRRAVDTTATARLMRSPLQVTIMTLLVDRMGHPPQERWALFNEYYKLIYQREIERDIPAAATLRDYRADINAIHRYVGLLLQIESEGSGGTDSKLTTDQFSAIVEQHLLLEGHEGSALVDLRDSIIEAAGHRLVFLVGLETGQVGFEIRSLQEFMAAEGLMDADDGTTQRRLRLIAPVSNWRNVFLFAAGKCFSGERRYLRDTIVQICADLNDDPDNPLARATLAGSHIALDLLEDGSASKQPNKCATLTRLAMRLVDVDDVGVLRRLIGVYHDRMVNVYVDELSTRMAGSSPRSRMTATACSARLIDMSNSELPNAIGDRIRTNLADASHRQAMLLVRLHDGRPGFVHEYLLSVIPRLPMWSAIYVVRMLNRTGAPRLIDPPWFQALSTLVGISTKRRQVRLSLHSPDDKGVIGEIFLTGIKQYPAERMSPIQDVQSEISGWRLLRAVVDFAKSPTSGALANALKIASTADRHDVDVLAQDMAAWPLTSLLRRGWSGDWSWAELIEGAERGDYGDLSTWEIRELEASAGIRPPLSAVDQLALEASEGWIEPSVDAISGFIGLLRQFPRQRFLADHGSPLQEAAVRLMSRLENVPPPAWTDEVIELVLGGAPHYSRLSILDLLAPSDPSDSRWHPIVTNLGTLMPGKLGRVGAMRLYELVSNAWRASPSASLYSAWGICAQSPHINDQLLPDPSELTEAPTSPAAVVGRRLVRVRRRGNMEAVLDEIAAVPGGPPAGVAALMNVLRIVHSSEELRDLLIKVHEVWSQRTDSALTYQELQRLLASYRSDLFVEETWCDLGFPPELRRAALKQPVRNPLA